MGTLALATSSQAAVVATIDVGGPKNITNELGSFSSSAMQTLITTTADLTLAGVLDSEGTFAAGDFSQDSGALSDKITGTVRYGRADNQASAASGSRYGFVSVGETWTPDAGLTHFGLITTPFANNDGRLTVTVTYSDATIAGATGVNGQTNWMGFHKAGQTITSIALSEGTGGLFGNYDDVSLVFVPEPSSAALLLGLGSIALVLRRRK